GVLNLEAPLVCVLSYAHVVALYNCHHLFGNEGTIRVYGFTFCREMVKGDQCWNSGEQADGRCNQVVSNSRRNPGHLSPMDICQANKSVHDAPDGTEQTNIRCNRTNTGQSTESLLQMTLITAQADTQNTLCSFNGLGSRCMAFFQFQELTQTLIENIFKASAFRIELGIVIQGIQFSARPEDFLEMFIIGLGFFITHIESGNQIPAIY